MKTTQTLETASRSRPRAGPTQKPRLSIVLELTFAAVSSSGVLASDGQQRGLRGLEGGVDHGDRARPARRRRRSGRQSARRRTSSRARGAQQVGGEHHRHARVAVAENRGERGDDRGRQPADQRDQADGGGTAVAVGEDDQRDGVGPGADDRAGPRQLQLAQRAVGNTACRARQDSRRCSRSRSTERRMAGPIAFLKLPWKISGAIRPSRWKFGEIPKGGPGRGGSRRRSKGARKGAAQGHARRKDVEGHVH